MATPPTDDSATPGAFGPGTLIADKFRIVHKLAEGGMGQVFVATQEPIGRKVAVKILKPELVNDDELRERFLREAVAISRLHHPNTITVLDYGEADNTFYIAMEYLEGTNLESLLFTRGALKPQRAVHIAAQIADALGEAHEKEVLHRDLKPPNIFISRLAGKEEDFIKVLDFGIAKLLDQENVGLTQAGMVFGTPEYMSPEQAMGLKIDGRSDLYALGVLLWQILTGKPPYRGATALETALQHTRDPIPALPDEIPEPLRDLVYRAMSKTPEERPADAATFAKELRGVLKNSKGSYDTLSTAAPQLDPSSAADAASQPSSPKERPLRPPTHDSSKRIKLIVAIGALMIVAALAGAIFSTSLIAMFIDFTPAQNPNHHSPAAQENTDDPKPQDNDRRSEDTPSAEKKTSLLLECEQGSASVFINGKKRGETPMEIQGEPGERVRVTFKLRGFRNEKERVRFPKTGDKKVRVSLKPSRDTKETLTEETDPGGGRAGGFDEENMKD